MCWCLCILCVCTVQVQLASDDGLKPLGKYTANGPTVAPSEAATGLMWRTSGTSSRLRLDIVTSDLLDVSIDKGFACLVLACVRAKIAENAAYARALRQHKSSETTRQAALLCSLQ